MDRVVFSIFPDSHSVIYCPESEYSFILFSRDVRENWRSTGSYDQLIVGDNFPIPEGYGLLFAVNLHSFHFCPDSHACKGRELLRSIHHQTSAVGNVSTDIVRKTAASVGYLLSLLEYGYLVISIFSHKLCSRLSSSCNASNDHYIHTSLRFYDTGKRRGMIGAKRKKFCNTRNFSSLTQKEIFLFSTGNKRNMQHLMSFYFFPIVHIC